MPRNKDNVFTFTTKPAAPNTYVEASWFNSRFNEIKVALDNSVSRIKDSLVTLPLILTKPLTNVSNDKESILSNQHGVFAYREFTPTGTSLVVTITKQSTFLHLTSPTTIELEYLTIAFDILPIGQIVAIVTDGNVRARNLIIRGANVYPRFFPFNCAIYIQKIDENIFKVINTANLILDATNFVPNKLVELTTTKSLLAQVPQSKYYESWYNLVMAFSTGTDSVIMADLYPNVNYYEGDIVGIATLPRGPNSVSSFASEYYDIFNYNVDYAALGINPPSVYYGEFGRNTGVASYNFPGYPVVSVVPPFPGRSSTTNINFNTNIGAPTYRVRAGRFSQDTINEFFGFGKFGTLYEIKINKSELQTINIAFDSLSLLANRTIVTQGNGQTWNPTLVFLDENYQTVPVFSQSTFNFSTIDNASANFAKLTDYINNSAVLSRNNLTYTNTNSITLGAFSYYRTEDPNNNVNLRSFAFPSSSKLNGYIRLNKIKDNIYSINGAVSSLFSDSSASSYGVNNNKDMFVNATIAGNGDISRAKYIGLCIGFNETLIAVTVANLLPEHLLPQTISSLRPITSNQLASYDYDVNRRYTCFANGNMTVDFIGVTT